MGLAMGLTGLTGAAAAQGADECSNATPIAGAGSFPFSTVGSTDSGSLGSCNQVASSDVWFEWTSGSETDYRFAICDPDYDAVVAIYDACGGTELGCEDAVGCTPSLFDVELDVFGLAPDTTYLIQVDGWEGLEGTGTLQIIPLGPPMNDDCSSAQFLFGTGSFPFDNRTASSDGQSDPACQAFGSAQIENDVWFEWTAPSSGLFSARTCSLTELDTRVAVYDMQACPPAGAIACDDDSCQFQSEVEFQATLGQCYLLRLGSFSSVARGQGFLEIQPVLRPTNDDCSNAEPIVGSGPFMFDTAFATTDGLADLSCDGAGDQVESDVWYRWTAPASGSFRAATCGGTTLDTLVAVYDDGACLPTTPLACGNNECGVQSIATFDASAGASYLVRIGSFGTVFQGAGSFTIDPFSGPAGDDCTVPQAIAGSGLFAFDTTGATTDGISDGACSEFSAPQIHNDLWFRWTPAATGQFRIATCGLTSLDTKLAVYADQACPPVAPLACSDDACSLQSQVVFSAAGGASYLVRVGSYAITSSGAGALEIVQVSGSVGMSYCTAAPNSAGPGATMSAFGSPSVVLNDFTLRVSGAPPVFGLFFYGPNQISAPFGDGFRCVGGATQRLRPPIMADAMGEAARAVDLLSPPAVGQLTADSEWNFQFWYRDAAAMGAGFNVSDGLEVLFE